MWTLIILAYLNGNVSIATIDFMEEQYCMSAKTQLEPHHKLKGPSIQLYCIQTFEQQ